MRTLAYIILTTTFLAACGGNKNDVSAKKAELEKIKKEIAALQIKAKALETDISKLEPAAATGKLVETETLGSSEFRSYLNISGKADADQSTIATAQVPGTVTRVVVKAGDRVSQGQALAYLDNTTLVQSRAQITQQLSFAETVYQKQKNLWEKGVGTEIQYLTAKNQRDALQKNLATLDAQINMYIVKSPINGTIESVDTKIGQTAAPGFPLFKVVNLSQLKAIADVAESYSGKIKSGDAVSVEFPDAGEKVESKIAFASKIIDPMNRTFRIEIKLNGVKNVKPNMIAKINIVDYSAKNSISVPANCIQSTEEGKYVVVAVEENGKTVAKRKLVKTGHAGGDRMEILEGLQTGDKVIVNGFQELNDGQSVIVSNPSAK